MVASALVIASSSSVGASPLMDVAVGVGVGAVSYTHLTLPTIYSV